MYLYNEIICMKVFCFIVCYLLYLYKFKVLRDVYYIKKIYKVVWYINIFLYNFC